ncbi:ArsR/SmtB family transcription factor [Falsiroseomonas selenitidurans]|uniref:Metalloregulator ArsR/SmtB family transcription factor n=1 Tax=Falsiroseomonas selenitidurans TaxID=2716335 RepID=A0ABX1E7W8_9PROT|nr:metalloregulator ArsR/SmtB family transcription factor [Falsiroseomonas selenitidurans]NKC31887.1 metalloregulator ArsR/SmtB family transcription factor [Falsiroseomonas selenitidurans]
MDDLLAQLRAAAEPTRLRLLALCGRGSFCVSDLCGILGQSQPRLSRHLKLLVEAGLLERMPEGANVFFQLPAGADLARQILARLNEDDPLLAADRRAAARLAADRARVASDAFRRHGADWDEMRALDLPASAIEAALLSALPERVDRLLDIGSGTGRLLEVLAPRCSSALGVDASREMLALARARLAERGLSHCAVRQADMYRLPLPDQGFDAVTLQMVLHYAEDPAAALAEAARVLRPGGVLVVVDLAPHARADLLGRFAHRWPGFDDAQLAGWLGAAGCALRPGHSIDGPLAVRVWQAQRQPIAASIPSR